MCKRNCLKPSKGIYADVQKESEFLSLDEIPNFASVFASYESYER